jgi:hypothetical protein
LIGQCRYISKSLFGLGRFKAGNGGGAKRSVKPEQLTAAQARQHRMALHVLAYNMKRVMHIFGVAGLIEAIRA